MDEDVNRSREQYTANGGQKQQQGASENPKQIWNELPPCQIAADTRLLKVAVFRASQCKTQLEAALIYASYGIPVLPCLWEAREYRGKLRKAKSPMPELGEGGVYHATVNPDQIKQWWTRWPIALIGVPGGRRTGMWFLDADSKEGHGEDGLGAWWDLEAQHSSAQTRAHLTGSKGLHFIFQWNTNRFVGCPVSVVPKGIEIKGEGGYVIFPPSPYEWNGQTVRYSISDDCYPEPAPEWLYDRILGKRPKGNGAAGGTFTWSEKFGKKRLDGICKLLQEAEQHHWDEATRYLWKFAKQVGGGAYDINAALDAVLEAAKLNPTAPPDYIEKVRRSFLSGVAQPEGPYIEDQGVLLDDFCAYMPQHSYIYIPTREFWPITSVNARIPCVDDKGIKASAWLDQNRPVEQMVWAPGREMFVHNALRAEGGWIKKDGATCFNRYLPPIIEPGDASKAGPWIEHVRKLFGDDAEHIIKWCAQRVQHPEIKINHALVLGSEIQGSSKDTMLGPVKRAIGHWNFQEANPQQILGRFNSFLQSVILRVNEVRDLGDINRYQFYDHTKALTASPPDVLRVEEKYINAYSILNCVGLIFTSNYRTNGIYLPAEDRRHFVAWSNISLGDFPEGYWNKIWGWYEAGGDRDVAAFLRGYNITDFDPKAPPPKTQAFWDIVDANTAPENPELADVFDKLGNPDAVCLDAIVTKAKPEFKNWLQDPKNRKAIPHRLRQCGYARVRNDNRVDGYWLIGKERRVINAKYDLSLKEQIAAAEALVEHEEKIAKFMG
jgi:hypothetical protein